MLKKFLPLVAVLGVSHELVADAPSYQEERVIEQFGTIDMAALQSLIRSHTSFILLDGRWGQWNDGIRIPSGSSLTFECTEEEAALRIPSKHSLIVVYGGSSTCPAAQKLADRLSELGYLHVVRYPGGLKEWRVAGNPLTYEHSTQDR